MHYAPAPSDSSLHKRLRPPIQLSIRLLLLPNMLNLLLKRLTPPILLIQAPPILSLPLSPPDITHSKQDIQERDAAPRDVKRREAHRDGERRLEGDHARDAQRDGAQVGEAADHGRHGEGEEDLAQQCADRAPVGEGEGGGQDGGLGFWCGGLGRDPEFVEDLEGCGGEGEEGGDEADDLVLEKLVSLEAHRRYLLYCSTGILTPCVVRILPEVPVARTPNMRRIKVAGPMIQNHPMLAHVVAFGRMWPSFKRNRRARAPSRLRIIGRTARKTDIATMTMREDRC